MRLAELLDVSVVQALAEANFKANGMPVGIVDAIDGTVLVGFGWQEICLRFHRAHPETLARCRESDATIASRLTDDEPCEYVCRNGLRDIGIPIRVDGEHLATLFLGQFFYAGEAPDRDFFVRQAQEVGFDLPSYLAALDRVPVFTRETVRNILEYNRALARFIAALAEGFRRRLRTEQALAAAVRSRDVFLSAASHELKTPLTSLDLVVEALERQIASGRAERVEDVAAKLPVIRRQSARLRHVIADMLDVSRIGEGRLELRLREIDLGDVAREVVEPFAGEAAAGSEISLRADAPVRGRWDPLRLDQVLTNLVSNAVKYGGGNPIAVAVSASDREARIDVTDRGIGIAPEELGRVFGRFERADGAQGYAGLGLGLWIAQQFVHAHGGSIEVRSEPGAGSTFTVRLPRPA